MKYKLVIEGRLDGLNEIIGAARSSKFGSASQKKKQQAIVTGAIVECGLRGVQIKHKVDVEIYFYEPNAMRDTDNIFAGMKFIFDALVNNGVLYDDSRRYIGDITPRVRTDKGRPRIEVTLTEII